MKDVNDLIGTFTFNKAVNLKVSFDKSFDNEYFAWYYGCNW